MDEKSQIERISAAAETLERTLARLEQRFASLEQKIDRIVAMNDERAPVAAAERKTLSASTAALLGKFATGESPLGATSADELLRALSIEQRIAVKAELARAGLLP